MKAKAHVVHLSRAEIEQALAAAKPSLPEAVFGVLDGIVGAYLTLLELLDRKTVSIQRLRRMLFGQKSEKAAALLKGAIEAGKGTPAAASEAGGRAAGAREDPRAGHGRNGQDAFRAAAHERVTHEKLSPGDGCPGCRKGKVYDQADRPGILVRVTGQPPLTAKVYELQKLRCNLCGECFEATPPPGVGRDKYDATSASMIGLLKYGGGFPFNRLDRLQAGLGTPVPASTQWEIVRDAAHKLEPVHGELVRQAAQGKVLHNDDTGMRILAWMGKRRGQTLSACAGEENEAGPGAEVAPERTGIFTSGIVSLTGGRRIALFFTGRRHAGENLEAVLHRRAEQSPPPIQMCDALSRNLPGDLKTIVANCLAHGRRKVVEVVENFPAECEHILRSLGEVYRHDAIALRRKLTDAKRLQFHQERSAPVMQKLQAWMEAQLGEKKVEPSSGLGEAIRYFLGHWEKLTLFLRRAGAPLDNNICERALKKAIMHRKNSLFYKTDKGAHVGDVYMTLIHTCELNAADPFDYLTEVQRHAEEARACPEQWLPWNYRRGGSRSPPR